MLMEINILGLVAALTAFTTIWAGHVSVRKIEAHVVHLWKPMVGMVGFGLLLEYAALVMDNRTLAVASGITGITLLWDAFEIKRQAKRIRRGHAPANPHNPRHAAMLADATSFATTVDILNRDPVGRAVSLDEAVSLATRQ